MGSPSLTFEARVTIDSEPPGKERTKKEIESTFCIFPNHSFELGNMYMYTAAFIYSDFVDMQKNTHIYNI